ncbi:MAG TPA: DUF3826 domain-containing protein [Puia sp.]|jgi:hypothetical protein
MKRSLLAFLTMLSVSVVYAGNEDSTYIRVITERAGKIVSTLGLPDSTSFYRIRTLVANQYFNLNVIYTERDAQLKQSGDKATIQQDVDGKVAKLHTDYLAKLGAVLSQEQVIKIKDGMTYSVLEVTYKGYQDELPNLTDEQKAYILTNLTEAREHAMDAESSQKKHAWFGKYKGRINNYLSAQGIDMKKAGEEWRRRVSGGT